MSTQNKGECGQARRLERSELEFELPEELIAQTPSDSRERARLLVYDPVAEITRHREIHNLADCLPSPCTLVFNDTKVLRARLRGRRQTGARVEMLLVSSSPPDRFRALTRPAGRLKVGERILMPSISDLEVLAHHGEGEVEFRSPDGLPALFETGRMPLPPYIRRKAEDDDRDEIDEERYQTVFAKHEGAVAAPTAGLHFTQPLLSDLKARGHQMAFVTLHVGAGTFAPVRVDDLEDHPMHSETYSVTPETAQVLNQSRQEGRPIVAVGTTSLRTLESIFRDDQFHSGQGETNLFIRPPYEVRSAQGLLTNFHLPGSTLLALVASIIGIERLQSLYREAIDQRYTFFSYGDAMLIQPPAPPFESPLNAHCR